MVTIGITHILIVKVHINNAKTSHLSACIALNTNGTTPSPG